MENVCKSLSWSESVVIAHIFSLYVDVFIYLAACKNVGYGFFSVCLFTEYVCVLRYQNTFFSDTGCSTFPLCSAALCLLWDSVACSLDQAQFPHQHPLRGLHHTHHPIRWLASSPQQPARHSISQSIRHCSSFLIVIQQAMQMESFGWAGSLDIRGEGVLPLWSIQTHMHSPSRVHTSTAMQNHGTNCWSGHQNTLFPA